MKKFVVFDEQGFPSSEYPAPPDSHVLVDAAAPLRDPDGRWLRPDGTYDINLAGSPAFGGADGRSPVFVPAGYWGKDWPFFATLKTDENPYGILRAPRPLTKAEQDAAAAQAEAATIAALEMSAVQARLAANQMGIRDEIDAVMASAETPRDLKDLWEYSPVYKRAHPAWDVMAGHINKTSADVTAWFRLGATL